MYKKIMIIAGIMTYMFNGNVFGQEKIATYNSAYFSKTFEIQAGRPNEKGDFDYYIDCLSSDSSSSKASLMLKNKQVPEFVEFLSSIKETFLKWKQTAIENKVIELDKKIEYKNLNYRGAFLYGKWNFDYSVNISARIRIINNKYLLIIDSDALQSTSNQFIKSDGFRFVFNSAQEIDELINGLEIEKVKAFYADKNGKEDLFKN
ncbi:MULTISPECIES: hypothetical protein [unclassified Flavobacterium]|uniref:hypothetical protein n=1 Tax=unclassified Flavobacterium TaxID=196869 RepID=UPI0025B941EA|nr:MULTISPECIES: hypothetical protein [unclassified Flavobacterium]